MLSSCTLDDANGTPIVLHETSKRALSSATGLIGVTGIRSAIRDRPSAHGGINRTRFQSGQTIALGIEVMSAAGIEDALAEFRAVTAPMLDTLDNGPALLKWTEGVSGLTLQRAVVLDGDVSPTLSGGAAYLGCSASFYAEDPRAYSQSLTTATTSGLTAGGGGLKFKSRIPILFTQAGTGSVVVTNAGNRSTPPTFRIYGYCVNPQVIMPGLGKRIVLQGIVNAGTYVELDTVNRTAKVNGTTLARGLIDSRNTRWTDLPRGDSSVRLIASAFDASARLSVLIRAAYA